MKKNGALLFVPTAVATLCAATALYLYHNNQQLRAEINGLKEQVGRYEQMDGNSFVVERISKQMEDIAYQQMDISDKRREEALYQMNIADQMRSKAENEQQKAQAAALKEVEARGMAEQQRELAVAQQRQAEYAKNVADTLSYRALGRSLASLSSTQHLAGNRDVAALLAYAAWKFTSDYRGNINIPVIFQALSQNSQSFSSKDIHRGGVSRIVPLDKGADNTLGQDVSVSRYGEITQWNYNGGRWAKQLLFNNPLCSFRDVCTDNEGTIYALDYNGVLQTVSNQQVAPAITLPEKEGWQRIVPIDNQRLLLASAQTIYLFDTHLRQITQSIHLSQKITALGKRSGNIWVFGNKGGAWSIEKDGSLKEMPWQVKGCVTAFVWSDKRNSGAAGTANGDIHLVDSKGRSLQKLIGHRSAITDLCFNNDFLFSASYDRQVNLWDPHAANSEAVTLRNMGGWVYCLSNADNNYIYAGDETGTIARFMVSPDGMAHLIHSNLKRDFTREEWNYYIGNHIPQQQLK